MNLDHTGHGYHSERNLYEDNIAVDKEIKVRIPLPYHIKLHTIKVLHGQSISTTVREALDAYFRNFDEARGGDGPSRVPAWGAAQPEPSGPSTLP